MSSFEVITETFCQDRRIDWWCPCWGRQRVWKTWKSNSTCSCKIKKKHNSLNNQWGWKRSAQQTKFIVRVNACDVQVIRSDKHAVRSPYYYTRFHVGDGWQHVADSRSLVTRHRWYVVDLISHEIRLNKNTTGSRVSLQWELLVLGCGWCHRNWIERWLIKIWSDSHWQIIDSVAWIVCYADGCVDGLIS